MMPSIEVAQKMAEVFGVTIDYLVGEQEVPNLLSQTDMVERSVSSTVREECSRDFTAYRPACWRTQGMAIAEEIRESAGSDEDASRPPIGFDG